MKFKLKTLLLALIFAVSIIPVSSVYPQTQTEDSFANCDLLTLQKAMALKEEMNRVNQKDLSTLWNMLKDKLANSKSQFSLDQTKARVLEKLNTDFGLFIKLQSELKSGNQGSPALKSSLSKLIGNSQFTGILQDVAGILKNARSFSQLNPLAQEPPLKGNQITVFKTLLVYMNLVLGETDELGKIKEHIQLLYPAEIPKSKELGMGQSSLCYFNRDLGALELLVPNSAYIFGGNWINGVCKGIDCSSFSAYCSGSSVRLTTTLLEHAWLEEKGGQNLKNTAIDPYVQRGLKTILNEFEVLAVGEKGAPQPGDLVVWRWDNAKSVRIGHVVIYHQPIKGSPQEFWGIEANREDNKSKEGIQEDRFTLNRKNANTYIFRRKRQVFAQKNAVAPR